MHIEVVAMARPTRPPFWRIQEEASFAHRPADSKDLPAFVKNPLIPPVAFVSDILLCRYVMVMDSMEREFVEQ